MASQGFYDDMSSPADVPNTPQPSHSHLPVQKEGPGPLSPQKSIVDGTSRALVGDLASQNTAKYNSPRPLSASITPPPSSQVPNIRPGLNAAPIANAATPSPPPTSTNGIKKAPAVSASYKPSAQEVAEASPQELRDMVQALIAENARLDNTAREARMEKAHYKLQNTLLTLESEEAIKHLEAEHELTRREVQVLQLAYQGRADANAPTIEHVAKLKAICKDLKLENQIITRRLERAKKAIELKEDQLEAAKDVNERLTQRIRENREHINVLRSPGGLFHIATPKIANSSYPATPQQYHRTPQQTPRTSRSIREAREHGQEPFAALLLADRVLSQENNSAPSTPIISRRPEPRTPTTGRHNRGVQSLSSLPTTPRSARPVTANSTLLPSAQFMPQSAPRSVYSNRTPTTQARQRRRKSRDSTISAEDVEEIARAALEHHRRGESEEIQESQASQSATEMLRADPRESFEVAASRTSTPNPVAEKSGLLQSKIFGIVTKPVEKRKREESYSVDYPKEKRYAS
ncbi:hypothetical protein ACMFMG_000931 [Clarireedia jacksonii]